MAKSVNVSGRMSVGRFEDEFEKTFGVRCNVKLSKWRNADNKATLASVRPKDFDAPKKVNLPIVGNMTVRTLKERFEANFGVMIELYVGRKIAPDNVTIGAIREGRVDLSKNKKVKKVEEEVMSTKTSDNSNESVSISDEQIKEFKEREKEAEYMGDYLYLAGEVGEAGDLQWAKKLLEVSFQKTEYLRDYISVAECVLKYDLGNDFAISCYKKAEDLATDFDDFNSLAKSILSDEDYGEKRLGDKEWGLRLVKQAESLEDKDYSLLVDTIEEYLEDKDWCVKLLKEWDSTDDLNCFDYQYLAIKIKNNTNDEDWLLRVYKKAIPKAEDTDDCISIANELYKTFKHTEKYDDSMITIIKDLYNEALEKSQEFNDYNKICEKYFDDKENDDLVMINEVFNSALEKAMELVFSGEDYEQESFIETLEQNGYNDKAKEIKDKLSEGISTGIVHDIDIDGNSTFSCTFDIDHAYYEQQTGDAGPERFSFEYDFEKGIILKYDYENAELESIKIPYEYEDSFESCWSLMQGENYIEMQGESVNDVGGNQSDKMEQIVETLDQYEFKKLANAVLSKVKDIEGVD